MPDHDVAAKIAAGISTLPLADKSGAQTVALVVFHVGSEPIDDTGIVAAFTASFPVRAEVGAQPVRVCDATGQEVPSLIVSQSLGELRDDGRQLWTLELRFVAANVPAHGWRTFAASYRMPLPLSPTDRKRLLTPLPPNETPLLVAETGIHDGGLPLIGAFFDIMDASGSDQEDTAV